LLNTGIRSLSSSMSSFFHSTVRLLPAVALFLNGIAVAQELSDAELQRRQAQQQQQVESRVTGKPDVFTPSDAAEPATLVLPEEKLCFTIADIRWQGSDVFDWLQAEGAMVRGKCVGAQGLRALQDHLTRQLLDKGYLTSRVLIPEQNLASGRLTIQIVPGRIHAVRDEGDAAGRFRAALPTNDDRLLNQRDLDQALENIRRLPGQNAVEFELVPGPNPGETDIVIKHPETKRWHGLITLDDSGADATGKYQLGASLMIDSPLGLYDALAITVNSNANYGNSSLGTRFSSIHWSVPIGYWSLFLSANRSGYKQTVAGYSADISYSGRSHGVEIGVGYIPYRSANAKGTIQARLTRKASRSEIDDTEIDVQRRDIVGYDLGYTHRQYLGQATLDLGVGLRGSLPKPSAVPGMIVGVPDWDGRYQIQTAHASLGAPFQLSGQQFHYQASWRIQHARTSLPGTEYFSIGGRYSVRGFDGAATLAAEDGWTLRNDLIWRIGQSGQQLYLALDAGRVGGQSADFLLGRTLVGAAIGLRGRLGAFTYDITAGRPISKPAGFTTEKPTLTASLAVEF
jgi:hemolysin activation/secretion protein